MDYFAIKHLHIGAVALSVSLFVLRGVWMCLESPLGQQRWTKIVPHIIDTVLLVSALSLIFIAKFKPAENPWLALKIFLLFVYIGLGSVALKHGKTKQGRVAALLGALLVVAYMVKLAITKQIALT